MILPSSTVLRPGGNIAIWPEVKLGRAHFHMMELQQRIEEWHALRPLQTTAEQVGASEILVRLEVLTPPPLETLAAVFGDAIHNLRSALDSVTWEMANFGGNRPATRGAEKAVQFPIYAEPLEFGKWAARVGSIPPELLERLELEQPYHRASRLAAQGMVDTVVKLHEIDVQDKHRNSVRAVLGNLDVSLMQMAVRGPGADDVTISPQDNLELLHGELLLKVTSAEAFELVEFVGQQVTADFAVPWDGGFAPLLELLGTMSGKVRSILDGLYGRLDLGAGPVLGSGETAIKSGKPSRIVLSGPATTSPALDASE